MPTRTDSLLTELHIIQELDKDTEILRATITPTATTTSQHRHMYMYIDQTHDDVHCC